MREAATKFIDKECLIYLLNGQVNGIIREVSDNSLLIETSADHQILNLDFVIRIREYPKNKHGKKKSIVLDWSSVTPIYSDISNTYGIRIHIHKDS